MYLLARSSRTKNRAVATEERATQHNTHTYKTTHNTHAALQQLLQGLSRSHGMAYVWHFVCACLEPHSFVGLDSSSNTALVRRKFVGRSYVIDFVFCDLKLQNHKLKITPPWNIEK